jgi:hypothetical protein
MLWRLLRGGYAIWRANIHISTATSSVDGHPACRATPRKTPISQFVSAESSRDVGANLATNHDAFLIIEKDT